MNINREVNLIGYRINNQYEKTMLRKYLANWWPVNLAFALRDPPKKILKCFLKDGNEKIRKKIVKELEEKTK